MFAPPLWNLEQHIPICQFEGAGARGANDKMTYPALKCGEKWTNELASSTRRTQSAEQPDTVEPMIETAPLFWLA